MSVLRYSLNAFIVFIASLALASGVFAQTIIPETQTGFVDAEDCGTLTGMTTNAVLCLQTTTTATRTRGVIYIWNGTQWAAYSAGSGITSLNGLAGNSQTFANDTNVTISSVGTTHTLGWTGTLAVARGGTGAGSASAARTSLGLVIGTDVQAQNNQLSALASTVGTGIYKITGAGTSGFAAFGDVTALFGGGSCGSNFLKGDGTCASGSVTETDPVVVAINGLVKSNGSAISAAVANTDYVTPTSTLTALRGLTSAADKLPYFTGSGTAATTDFSAFARTLVDDADAATARTTLGLGTMSTVNSPVPVANGGTASTTTSAARTALGLAIGTDVQAFDSDLAALAANSATGFWAITGAGTGAARTILGTTGNVTVANGGGGGNVTIDLGTTAVQTDQANTFTTGDQDCGLCASLTLPKATGAAPTADGRIAFDTTSHRAKLGINGATKTIPHLDEVQPVNANLTAFSALAGVDSSIPIFTGAGTMLLAVLPSCPDSGGKHLNYDTASHLPSCGTSSTGGLSGATVGKYLIATGASAFDTSGNLSETAGVVNAASGFTVGNVATNYLGLDTSAVTGAKTATVQNQSGTLILGAAAGTFTNGHVITATVAGGVVSLSDGGAAGSGTVTASSTDTFTNKTLDVEGTGNSITTVSKIWLPTAGGTAATPVLLWDTLATNAPTAACSAGSTETTLLRCTADFPDSDGDYSLQVPIMLPSDWSGNIDLKFLWRAAATSGDAVWQATLVCRADGEVDDAVFNTTNTVTDTVKGTTNQLNTATISSMTLTGCSAGELAHLKVLRNRTNASDTIAGVISLVGVEVTARRAQ